MKNKTYLAVFFLLNAWIAIANAQSIYSSRGIGLIGYFVNGRASGMGGVGLSMPDQMTVSFLNPASLAALPLTTISGNFVHSVADLMNSRQEAKIADTNVHGVQFVIPLKQNRAAISLGLNPYSSIEYTFISDEASTDEMPLVETIEGNGGVNTAFFSFSIRPFRRLYLGATGLFYFGVLKNKWIVDFEDASFLDTRSEVSHSISGLNVRLGFIFNILSGWHVAGVYTPKVTLDSDASVTLNTAELEDFPSEDFELPEAFGLGTSITLGKKLIVGADYYKQNWSEFSKDGFVNDSERISVGVEYSGRGTPLRSSYFSRMAVRAGFYYSNLGLEEPLDNEVTEFFGSVGVSLPIKWSAARIDLALEVGQRGSESKNPFRENVVRLTGSITVGERWFFRGNR